MARPRKDGLDYFSFDTDFFDDSRIDGIKARFGIKGVMLLLLLYARTYRDKGYYLVFDEDMVDKLMAYLGVTEDYIWQVMAHFYSRSILVKTSKPSIPVTVTSPGIQKRYQAAVRYRKRTVEVDADIWLLGPDETESFIKVTSKRITTKKNPVNHGKNSVNHGRNATKESKVNKSKLIPPYPPTEKLTASSMIEDRHMSPSLEKMTKEWVKYKSQRREGYKETGLNCLLSEICNKAGRYGDEAVISAIRYSMSNGYKGILWEHVGREEKHADKASGEIISQQYDFDAIEKKLLGR